MGDSEKVTAPEDKQSGGSSILERAPENVKEYLKNKLPEGISDEEAAFKLAEIGMNSEKLIGRKKEAIIDSLFENEDSKLMQALKEKGKTEQKAEVETKPVEGQGPPTKEEAQKMLREIMGDEYAKTEERIQGINQQLSESEKRMQQERLEQQITQLDTSYRQLTSQIPEEEIGPYVKPVLEILWDEKTGGPREEFRGLYHARNPVKAALLVYLGITGSNPELLSKLSKPVYTEGGGVNMPAGKASSKSPTDEAFLRACEADKPHRLYELNTKK